jgi:succinate dehydrogenase/fumarate reductase flavoprotein subunit
MANRAGGKILDQAAIDGLNAQGEASRKAREAAIERCRKEEEKRKKEKEKKKRQKDIKKLSEDTGTTSRTKRSKGI